MTDKNKKIKFKVTKENNEDNFNITISKNVMNKNVPSVTVSLNANKNTIPENKNPIEIIQITDEIQNINNSSNINLLSRKTRSSGSENLPNERETFEFFPETYYIPIYSEYSNWKEKANVTLEKIKNKFIQMDKDLEVSIKINFADFRNYDFNSEKDMKSTLNSLEKKFGSKIKSIHFETINKFKRNTKISDYDFPKIENYLTFIKQIFEENTLELTGQDIEDTLNKFILDFGESCFEEFEKLVVLTLTDKYKFAEVSSYVYLYIYDNMRKLRDAKTLDSLKTKLKEANVIQHLNLFSLMMCKYYKKREEMMTKFLEKNLRISNYDEDNSLVEIIITSFLFIKFESLREIDLTQYYVMNENFMPIFSAIRVNTQINRIVLNSNKLGEEGAWHLGRLLTFNKNITELDISINLLSDDALKAIVLALHLKKDSDYKLGLNTLLEQSCRHQTSLNKLSLFNNSSLTASSGKHIANLLEASPNLKILNISKINLEDVGFCEIINRIKENSKLETLIAYNTKLNSEALYTLGQCLKQPNLSLSSLTLSDNKFDKKALKDFFVYMADNKCVKELNLTNCDITNDHIEEICVLLEKNRTLENFILYNNKIDAQFSILFILARVSSHKYTPFCKSSNTYGIEAEYSNFNSLRDELLDMPIQEPDYDQIKKITLKHLDLSKNKCKLDLTDNFIEIISKLELQTLDISQNFEFPTSNEEMSKKFKDIITNIQDKTKIIY